MVFQATSSTIEPQVFAEAPVGAASPTISGYQLGQAPATGIPVESRLFLSSVTPSPVTARESITSTEGKLKDPDPVISWSPRDELVPEFKALQRLFSTFAEAGKLGRLSRTSRRIATALASVSSRTLGDEEQDRLALVLKSARHELMASLDNYDDWLLAANAVEPSAPLFLVPDRFSADPIQDSPISWDQDEIAAVFDVQDICGEV